MASRLLGRLKQLHKSMGMIPLDAEKRRIEDHDLERSLASAEAEAGRLMELLKQSVKSFSLDTKTGEIVYGDGRRESLAGPKS